MSERKVLNKYYPPDFDPALIPRAKRPKVQQHKVRLMAPYSMRCNTCGEFIAQKKKFNARKESVVGEMYLNIQVFRFYIRCPRCAAEITFKTDPQNVDYVPEHGAKRNFENAASTSQTPDERRKKREEEEANDPMKALENRTLESKREMEELDALDELRTRSARSARVDTDKLLETLREDQVPEEEEPEFTEEEEQMIKDLFKAKKEMPPPAAVSSQDHVREAKARLLGPLHATQDGPKIPSFAARRTNTNSALAEQLGVVLRKPASVTPAPKPIPQPAQALPEPVSNLTDLLGAYDSSDQESSSVKSDD
ncbi:Pre-mRNA-splicing factor cwf16 [Dimargaris cristalligena]|nr:Pre-mRNA-splicing factor cwf16 [Dimargaris cristalligena]